MSPALKTAAARVAIGLAVLLAPILIGLFVPNGIILGALVAGFLFVTAYVIGWCILEWIEEARER